MPPPAPQAQAARSPMNLYSLILTGILSLAPALAWAHATPISYSPENSSVVQIAPKEILIEFSEHVDAQASTVTIHAPDGSPLPSQVPQAHNGGRTLTVPFSATTSGAYTVSWSAVSQDDGHFTKGTYVFALGSGSVTTAASVEIVHITTGPEALAMTVELAGNGLIWAALVLFIVLRKKRAHIPSYDTVVTILFRTFFCGALLAIVGGISQILLKSSDLAGISDTSFARAVLTYIKTAAGLSTAGRVCIAVGAALVSVFHFSRSKLSIRLRFFDYALTGLMILFALLRAVISHATANPFHPNFSIAVNVVHLIEKDIWFGIVAITAALMLIPKTRSALHALLGPLFSLLALTVGLISVTASYIIWLHLKSFENLFSTGWGSAFLALACAAILVLAIRIYHTVTFRYRPELFSKLFPFTISLEAALALIVIYTSSIVIITSPPLPSGARTLTVSDNGATITLTRSISRDGELLLSVSSENKPLLVAHTTDDSVSLSPQKRFTGGYAIPLALIPTGTHALEITLPQNNSYDAHAVFPLDATFLATGSERYFDSFAVVFAALGLFGAVLACILFYLSNTTTSHFVRASTTLPAVMVITFVMVVIIGGASITRLSHASFANPYKTACESNGDMWHLMQPTWAGVPTSKTPREGCMWGMGAFPYQFPDRREYEYYRSLPPASVTYAVNPKRITEGVPTNLTFSFRRPDGSPAPLFIDMERIFHVVIISKDQKTFAHIHPEDLRPISADERDKGVFTVQYTFPRAGAYLVAVDYANGLTLGSHHFTVNVAGVRPQQKELVTYEDTGTFSGYTVSLDNRTRFASEVETLQFTVKKDGQPVKTLEPYLAASMHVSVVKNDLSTFIHTHGEVHTPGTPQAPITVKNGKVLHSMKTMSTPDRFGPNVEAHLIFPSAGIYTVWAQFKVSGEVIPAAFTIRVEE